MKKIESLINVDRAAKVTTKILEVCHWVAAALMVGAIFCALFMPEKTGMFVGYSLQEDGAELSVYGFEVIAPIVDGRARTDVFVAFSVGAVILIVMMAWVFRELNGIIKRSEGSTPFRMDNVKAMRRVGFILMALPIVGLNMGFVVRLVAGPGGAEISNGVEGFVMGIIALCLTHFFAHGVELENDMDGLV